MSRASNLQGGDRALGKVHLPFGHGIDNRSHATALDAGYVRQASNVDIDRDGIGHSREGYGLWIDLPGAHSGWDHPMLTFALVADAPTLYRLDDAGTLRTLVTGLNGGKLSYGQIGQHVFWSNGVQTGKLDLSGEPAPWGVETPLPSFGVTAIATGGLYAGTYGVTMTFADANREEGGAPDTVFVDVPEGGGIRITDVPVDAAGMATEARIYVTEANSNELFYVGSANPGVGQFIVGAGQRLRLLATQFCEPFPAAGNLLGKAGRLIGSIGRRMVYSQAMYYGLWRPTQNSKTFPDEITMIAAPDTAQFMLYIGTRKKVYLLQGDSIDSCTLSVVCAAGVQPGSMVMVPAEVLHMDGVIAPIPLWAGTDGVPYAGSLSGVLPLSDKFVYPVYDQAAAAFVQQGGHSRFIVSGQGGRTSGLAMKDTVSVEVIHQGP